MPWAAPKAMQGKVITAVYGIVKGVMYHRYEYTSPMADKRSVGVSAECRMQNGYAVDNLPAHYQWPLLQSMASRDHLLS